MTNAAKAVDPKAVIFSMNGDLGCLYNVQKAGSVLVCLPGPNPGLIDGSGIVGSCSPVVSQLNLISISSDVSSTAEGIANAAKVLLNRRVQIVANHKSRVGIITHVEKDEDSVHRVFLAGSGGVEAIKARDIEELQERPQEFFFNVQVSEPGTFVLWLKNFVSVDVNYTLSPKRLRVNASVRSKLEPLISFTPEQVTITTQALASLNDQENLQGYTVSCSQVSVSTDATRFRLFSGLLEDFEQHTCLKYLGFLSNASGTTTGIDFEKATTFKIKLVQANQDTEQKLVEGLLGACSFASAEAGTDASVNYSVCEVSRSSEERTWLISVDGKKLTYDNLTWTRETSSTTVPVLIKHSDSERLELVTYKNTAVSLCIRSFKLEITDGPVLVKCLPPAFTKVGVTGNEVIRTEDGFKFSVTENNIVIVFTQEVSQKDKLEKHSNYLLMSQDGTVRYSALGSLPESIFGSAEKPNLLRYQKNWAAYQTRVAPLLAAIKSRLEPKSGEPDYPEFVRFVKNGELDSFEEFTADLKEPAEELLAVVRTIAVETWNR